MLLDDPRFSAVRTAPVLALLAGYFLLQVLLRASLSDSLDLDEAEQVLIAQQLQWGYGSQPPLYAWLQWLLFQIFGLNLFALAALKNALLFSTYACVYFLARPLIGGAAAATATVSLLLFPQIAWESQRDLTHSVLLTALAAATLWCYLDLLRRPTTWRYLVLGALIGLGLQAKYNYALLAAGLALTSLLLPEHRRIVWNRKLLLTLVLAALLLLPHGWWLLQNLGSAADGTLNKMRDGHQAGYLATVARGWASMWLAALAFATPFWLVYGWGWWRSRRHAAPALPGLRFFLVLYLVLLGLMTLMILSGQVGKIKDRWMQPLLFSLPVACFLAWPALARPEVARLIRQVAACMALLVLLGLPARVLLTPLLGKEVRAHHPYPELAAYLERQFPQAGLVLASDRLLGGNLYFQHPRRPVVLLEQALVPASASGSAPELPPTSLVVLRQGARTDWRERLLAVYPDARVAQTGRLDLPYRFGAAATMSFEYALIRNGSE